MAIEIRKAWQVALQKIVSRKLLVWVVATGLTIAGILAPDQWYTLSMLYMGVQWAQDMKHPNGSAPKNPQGISQ